MNSDDASVLHHLSCDGCGELVPRIPSDPEFCAGFTVQIGEFVIRADDSTCDTYDEPDNDQWWFCASCWRMRSALMVQALNMGAGK